MKINITKKNVIVASVGFLAGIIITTSGFLIFRGCTKKQHERTSPPSFSQSQTDNRKEINGENNQSSYKSNSNQNKQSPKNKSNGNKETKDKTSKPENGGSTADNSNNS